VPRILPVLIPQLVAMVPSFIFLEATLGLFNIKSIYPTWGRIIYEGLARGGLYGSPFWVLEPIFLLLLTGFAFAMLGSALERILNPRIIADIPVTSEKATRKQPNLAQAKFNKRVIVIATLIVVLAAILVPSTQGKTLASVLFDFIDQKIKYDPRITSPSAPIFTRTPAPSSTALLATPTEPFSTLTPSPSTPSTSTVTSTQTEVILTPSLTASHPLNYTLHAGEYPSCIARRFDVDPMELLALNGISNRQTVFTGMVLQIPQSGKPFPAERRLRDHPRIYTVSSEHETLYTIACQFGDLDPQTLAQSNNIPLSTPLFIGRKLSVP